jgi:uncharacterized protein with PQ loop repeat
MAEFFNLVPIAATAFGIPQFLPQLVKIWRSGATAGVSWSWAALGSVSNAAWFIYFWLSSFWMALAPASSAALLAGTLAVTLGRRGRATLRPMLAIVAWVALLASGFAIGGRAAFGSLLAVSFVLQVIPSLWTAYRTTLPSGISAQTWSLIFAELLCWGIYGVHKADPRLIVLGGTGVAASLLILSRLLVATRRTRMLSRVGAAGSESTA